MDRFQAEGMLLRILISETGQGRSPAQWMEVWPPVLGKQADRGLLCRQRKGMTGGEKSHPGVGGTGMAFGQAYSAGVSEASVGGSVASVGGSVASVGGSVGSVGGSVGSVGGSVGSVGGSVGSVGSVGGSVGSVVGSVGSVVGSVGSVGFSISSI